MTNPIEALAEHMKAAALSATPGPWTCDKPPVDAATGFRRGVAIAATYGKQMIYADPPGGSYPAADQRHIAASNPADVLAVLKDRDALKAQLEDVATERDAWQMEFEGGSEVAGARLAALACLLKEAEDVLKPFADIVGPFRAATEAGRHCIPDEAFRRVTPLLARIAAVQKGE